MKNKLILLAALSAVTTPALADEAKRNWSAAAEVGFNITSGNTKTQSMKTRFDFKQALESWDTNYIFDALRKKDKDEVSASKWLFSAKGNYKLTEKNSFLFITGTREEDKFSTYDNYNTVAVGYGRRLFETEKLTLDADIGPGYAFYEYNENDETDNSAIVNISGILNWNVSESADFSQKVLVIQELSDEKNTKTRLESALTASINGSLKMKLGLTILNNTEVKPGDKKTDTETSITLVYAF